MGIMKGINRNEPYTNPATGVTYVFPRSYNTEAYTYENYLNHGINRLVQKDLYVFGLAAKMKCLKDAGKEMDTTMLAIEKDEDYLGEFKTCVTSTVNQALAERNAIVAQRKEALTAAGKKFKPTLEYTLPEDKAEPMINQTLDMIKLNELKEHDHWMYK